MPTRTRSILIDNTLGKIFTGVANSGTTDVSKLIAGTKIQNKGVSAPSKNNIVAATNIGDGKGVYFSADSLIVQVVLKASIAPKGRAAQVRLKKGSDGYSNSTVIDTYSLPANSVSATINTNISILAGQSVFADVVQGGSTTPGQGLSIAYNYYSG
jgi:hypothetical protein